MADPPPPRVRVTGPPRHRHAPLTRPADIDADDRLGEVYFGSLLRAQFWLAVRIIALLMGGLGSLPLVFYVLPALGEIDVAGVPVPWVLLGVAAYPFLFVLGWRYVRKAEQNEANFVELLTRERGEDR